MQTIWHVFSGPHTTTLRSGARPRRRLRTLRARCDRPPRTRLGSPWRPSNPGNPQPPPLADADDGRSGAACVVDDARTWAGLQSKAGPSNSASQPSFQRSTIADRCSGVRRSLGFVLIGALPLPNTNAGLDACGCAAVAKVDSDANNGCQADPVAAAPPAAWVAADGAAAETVAAACAEPAEIGCGTVDSCRGNPRSRRTPRRNLRRAGSRIRRHTRGSRHIHRHTPPLQPARPARVVSSRIRDLMQSKTRWPAKSFAFPSSRPAENRRAPPPREGQMGRR